MKFTVLDHIREAGDENTPKTGAVNGSKPNDDWLNFDERLAIVADGATGLTERRLVLHDESDAQWVAKTAVKHFLSARADDNIRDLVRENNENAARVVALDRDLTQVPRYAWPTAGFIMARLQTGLVEITSLGDCVALIEMSDGYVERFCALPDSGVLESEAAGISIDKLAGENELLGDAVHSPAILAELREKRALSNTVESGVWTLGLAPEASGHVFTVALPASEISTILLMSDGFSAAQETYDLYDAASLMRAAKDHGLSSILAEIRRIERFVDRECRQFPRYKRSDDSSAILLEISKSDDNS